ncbi:hypothetical protein AD006_29360 (plasmid) [Pseudonocardia sp. EC080610-09]|nr:hypothetical protein AD006_29360 [Pseudonocardia sp. EC080610-09]ALL85659.1 hypothetical protein AD017_31895 [Pseudonocardia sp. EC080619-01]
MQPMTTITSLPPTAEGAEGDWETIGPQEEAIRRLTEENLPRISTGQLARDDIVDVVEQSWVDLQRAGAPPATLPELLERLAQARLDYT